MKSEREMPNPYRHFRLRQPCSILLPSAFGVVGSMPTINEEAEQRTDCHATDGLVATRWPAEVVRARTQIRTAQRGSIPIARTWPFGPTGG